MDILDDMRASKLSAKVFFFPLIPLQIPLGTACHSHTLCFSRSQGWQFQAIFMTDALVWTYVLFASVWGDYIRLKGACAFLALLCEPEREILNQHHITLSYNYVHD